MSNSINEIRSSKEELTIVGAGPVGSLLSIMLSQKGYRTQLYESRPDLRNAKTSAGRSINLAISCRGLHALGEMGLEKETLKISIPMPGRMIHSREGQLTFQPYGKDSSQHINSISRAGLNKLLLDKTGETGLSHTYFRQRAVDFNTERALLTIRNEGDGSQREIKTHVLFGTDGSGSRVREAILSRPGYCSHSDKLEHGYKELLLPGSNGRYLIEKNALHIWPRGHYMLIALPNEGGSFTCTLFLPFNGKISFEQMSSPKTVRCFFDREFPDFSRLMPTLEEEFFSRPIGEMVTVKCFPWSYSSAVLLGDAAHAIVPFFGQGMNCGFEDVSILNSLIPTSQTFELNWPSLFSEFCLERKHNADAIAQMAVENFIEMRDKTADPQFQLAKRVEKILQKEFEQYIPRYSLVSFTRVPYSKAYAAGKIHEEILSELCDGIQNPEDVDLARAKGLIEEKLPKSGHSD